MTTPQPAPSPHPARHARDDLSAARPRLRTDVVLGSAQQRGPMRFHQVRVLGTGRSLEMGAKEHFVLSRLDGTWSLAEIAGAYQREFGKVLAPGGWAGILATLHQKGLLAHDEQPPAPPARPRVKGGRHALRLPRTPGRTRTVRIVRAPEPLLDGVLRSTRAAFSPWLVLPLVVAVVGMEVLLVGQVGRLAEQTARLFREPGPLVVAAVASWLLAAVHEVAHGVAARRYGVPVLEIGVRWLPPLVVPYCRTDSYLYLPRRLPHVVIAGAGVLVELALLLPAFAAWWWMPAGTTADALAALLLCGSFHALLNLAPVPPLDGYRLLSHALGLSDYARQAGLFVALTARRDPRRALYPRKVRLAYLGYAGGTVTVAVAATGLVLLASHTWLGGWTGVAGTAAVLLAAAATAGVRVARAVRKRARAVPVAAAAGAHPVTPAAPTAVPPRTRPTPGTAHTAARIPAREGPRAPGPSVGAALVLDGVVKDYAGVRAVDGVSLEVGTGEFVGLLGPNGAGKTTLVEVAVGLRRADAGDVRVLGELPWPRRRSMLRRVGVQTQSAAFFVRLTAREHLRTVAALYGLGPDAAEEALHVVGLGRCGNTRADRLSGGQQQRLAIASALVHDPELIFLDEPTASLDPQARRELWSVLRKLHAAGRTVIYTTHHIDEAEALCTRVAIMSRGAVVASGAPYDLIDAAALPTRVVVPRNVITLDAARGLNRVASASLEGPSVVIETHDSAAVLAELDAVSGVRGVRTRTPTLEDVYLDCIGSEQAS